MNFSADSVGLIEGKTRPHLLVVVVVAVGPALGPGL